MLTRRLALLGVVCILLPTLVLGAFAFYTYLRSQRFAAELANEFVPYGINLVRDRLEERYRSECLALLDRFRNRAGVRSMRPQDLTFMFEGMGISQSVFQYPGTDSLITTLPPRAIAKEDIERIHTALQNRLTPDDVDSLLHFLRTTLNGREYALPYVYSFDSSNGKLNITGFIPDDEYIERVLFPTLLHSDIFSGPDIFQGELLEKYFVFDISRLGTPVASTRLDYTKDRLSSKSLDDIFPSYSIGIHYSDVKFRTLENYSPVTLWALIGIPVVIFAVGFYFFLRLTIREINLSRAKSHFISNVSHELKTPLGLIRLYNETLELKRYSDDKERRGFHRTITRETVRLADMINRLLSFSRMERGQKQYDFKAQDLAEIAGSVLDDYGPQFEEAGFELLRKFDGPIEPLPLDRESISQAVINLLDNAMKYSGDERIVSVTVGEDAKGPFIEVADKGIGIPADQLSKIFEKFYRVEQSLIHDVKGLGIGLAVVKKIMEDHGGSVEVKSKEGEGSRFTLRFKRDSRTATVRERTLANRDR